MINENVESYVNYIINLKSSFSNVDILKHFVDIVFYENSNSFMKRHVIIDRLSVLLKEDFDDGLRRTLQNILDDGIELNIFDYNEKDEAYNIKEDRFNEVSDFMKENLILDDTFRKYLLGFIDSNIKSLNCDKTSKIKIAQEIELTFNQYFYKYGFSIIQKIRNREQELINEDSNIINYLIDNLKSYEFNMQEIIEINLAFTNNITDIISDNSDYFIKLLEKAAFIKYFNFIKDQSKLELLEKRVFYLDTNVIIALLFDTHEQHDEVKFIVNKCKDFNIKLRVTSLSIEEFKRLVTHLTEIDVSLVKGNFFKNSTFIKSISDNVNNNVIYKYYLMNKNNYGNFHSFKTNYCEGIVNYLSAARIELLGVSSEIVTEIHSKENFMELVSELQSYKENDGHLTNENSAIHDIEHFFYIERLRNSNESYDELGQQIWFLSLDKKLEKFRFKKNLLFRNLITISIKDIYDLLLPFYFKNKDMGNEYIVYLFKSNIGNYKSDSYIDIDILKCIFDLGFDMDQLEGLSTKEQIELLYAIQANKKLLQKCQRAEMECMQPTNTSVAEELKLAIAEIKSTKISNRKDKDDAKTISKMAEELKKSNTKIEALQKFKDEYEAAEASKLNKANRNYARRIATFIIMLYNKLFHINKKDE